MNKILVLGASGQLGNRIISDVKDCSGTYNSHSNIFTPKFFKLNISDFEQFKNLVKTIQPTIIINCIGFTKVDLCEKLPEKNWLINNSFPVDVAIYCKQMKIKFVHISTDHFETNDSEIISESSKLISPNQYSFAKLTADNMIQNFNSNSLIVRANFFQFNLKSSVTFIDNMFHEIAQKNVVRSIKDIYSTPISITYLIKYILNLIEIDYSGIINISSDQVVSKYEFHEMILSCFNIDKTFHESISIDDLNLPAKRAKHMALDNSLLKSIFGDSKINIYDMIIAEKLYQEQRSIFVSR